MYGGPQRVRDLAYHQGTVWPWLLGGYWLAVLRLGGFDAASRAAVADDLAALAPALREGCIGQLPEILRRRCARRQPRLFCPGLERG